MIRQLFAQIAKIVSQFLQHPFQVFVVCICLVSAGLVFDGSLIRLWRLHRDSNEIVHRMQVLQNDSKDLESKIQRARDPNFIELEARDKFDLASEGDLIFVFSDEN
jgi:cell division protein FtsB